MNSNLFFDISSIFSAIPFFYGIYLLWKFVDKETNERQIIKNIFTGMIIGLISGLFFVFLSYGVYSFLDLSLMLVIIFPIYLEMVKFILYQRKKYWGKRETVLYGYGLGIGIGATFSLSMLYYYFVMHQNVSIIDYLGLLLFTFSMVFINITTTLYISYGICKKKRKMLENSMVIMILYFVTLLPFIWGFDIFYVSWNIVYVYPFYHISVKKMEECKNEKN